MQKFTSQSLYFQTAVKKVPIFALGFFLNFILSFKWVHFWYFICRRKGDCRTSILFNLKNNLRFLNSRRVLCLKPLLFQHHMIPAVLLFIPFLSTNSVSDNQLLRSGNSCILSPHSFHHLHEHPANPIESVWLHIPYLKKEFPRESTRIWGMSCIDLHLSVALLLQAFHRLENYIRVC